MADVEGLLRRALAPVDPPEDLATRVRTTLQSISDMAAEELEGWELSAMRDPRRWARPAVAAVAGAAAGTGLLVLSLQRRGRPAAGAEERGGAGPAATAGEGHEPR